MLNKFIAITVSVAIGMAAFGVMATGEPSLKDQILAIDKSLLVMRKATQSDPEVKAARVALQVALDKLNATVDAVMVRTNPKGKELLAKQKKLLEQYQAQPKAAVTKDNPTQ